MPNIYAPYSTSNTAGVNVEEVYGPETLTPYNPPAPFALGQIVEGTDDSEWVFCLATEGIAIGNVVQLDNNFNATRLTTANGLFGRHLGVAPVAVTLGQFFWAQTEGVCAAITASSSAAANVQLAATATPGALDDVVTTGTKDVTGITWTTAPSGAGNFAGLLNNPTVGETNL